MKTATTNQVGQISLEMAVTGTNCTKSQAAPSAGFSQEHRKPAAIAAAVETQAMKSRPLHLPMTQRLALMNQAGQIVSDMIAPTTKHLKTQDALWKGMSLTPTDWKRGMLAATARLPEQFSVTQINQG